MNWIDTQFPKASGQYEVTSQEDGVYNCIAWAVNDQTEWWSHLPGYKWPAPRSPKIESLVAVFAALGYKRTTVIAFESGFEKVALYHKDGMWAHAARQLPSGKWASKLGPDEDIHHNNPECLCGDTYGEVHCLMKKQLT